MYNPNPTETSFCPAKHQKLIQQSEEYRKGYEYAAARMPQITVDNLQKMAFIFLGFNQLNAAGMAYRYWELSLRRVAA